MPETMTFAQATYKTEYVVSQDGRGDFTTIQDVLRACKAFADGRITIHIKPGIYNEKIEVYSWLVKISLIGEDAETTQIIYNDYSGKENINTFTSYTAKIMGNDFYAENITFANTAGSVGQAVALHVEGDRCIYRNCRFIGNQDTIYTGGEHSRQYFDTCYIEGTTDFIFGAATTVFKDCHILSKKNSYITAASTTQGNAYGYVFINCVLKALPEVTKVYLGRPWRIYAKTVFIDCDMGAHILPAGWHDWNKPEARNTTYYGEYASKGDGGDTRHRVAWSHQLTREEVQHYSVEEILKGSEGWNAQLKD
jgi:pectinesterase